MAKQFNPGNVPDALYKYRCWGNANHKRVLTRNELFLARPSGFNDPFDSRTPTRWDDFTEEDCFQWTIDCFGIPGPIYQGNKGARRPERS